MNVITLTEAEVELNKFLDIVGHLNLNELAAFGSAELSTYDS